MLTRLRRKFSAIGRYSALAYSPSDRRDLRLLGLWRLRMIPLSAAAKMTSTGSAAIAPRLRATNGEPVSLTLGDFSELDCFDELFLDAIYDLSRVPFEPDLVADCGAFRGYFAVLAAGAFRGAKIVCFEPNPLHHAALRAQLAKLSHAVELVPAAVGAVGGTAVFAGQGMGGALVGSGQSVPDSVTVKVEGFPDWLSSRRPHRLVWKLDIEGAEADVLPAALPVLPRQTVLFLETHFNDTRSAELIEPYRRAGFEVEQVRRRDAGQIAYIEWLLWRN